MKATAWQYDLGANPVPGGGATRFRVWAPKVETVALQIVSGKAAGTVMMQQEEWGYFSATVQGVGDGDRYFYKPGDAPPRPDPVSRYQPDGVHEASQVVDPSHFLWQDEGWSGIPLEQYVIYELHVGTFTKEGTFEAVIGHLDYLLDLGVTAVEVMPVSQFPGNRGWGYDGVCHFAPQSSYGGPGGLKQLVNACHRKGLAIILDVVYNHLGPEGNHLADFGDYFTARHNTPWGRAMNFDGADSDQVREFFIANALYWIDEYHFDALRMDAVDWIIDQRARHFLQEIAEVMHSHRERQGRPIYLFAENDTNDMRLINPFEYGGYGIDAQWCDNFHHALRTIITGETTGYYEDFGQFSQMVKAYTHGYVYTGEYSRYRRRCHGGPIGDRPTSQLVVFSQNHDQVGNRKCGDRLSATQPLDKLLLAAGAVLLSPYIPLLFMGEEYGEKAPFHYFVGYEDPELIAAVRKGKHEEHASGVCEGEIPDPEADATFLESKINLSLPKEDEQAVILEFYRALLALRKRLPALRVFNRAQMEVTGLTQQRVMIFRRWAKGNEVVTLFNFSNIQEQVSIELPEGTWEKVLDTSEQRWRGHREAAPPSLAATGSGSISLTMNPFTLLVYTRNA